jgi:cell division protein FtsL
MVKTQLRRALQILAGVIVIALVVGLYKAKTDAGRTEAHVRQLQSEIENREADLRALRAEIARQESPANVEALAEDRLGLAPAGENAALPENAIDRRLPAPEHAKAP